MAFARRQRGRVGLFRQGPADRPDQGRRNKNSDIGRPQFPEPVAVFRLAPDHHEHQNRRYNDAADTDDKKALVKSFEIHGFPHARCVTITADVFEQPVTLGISIRGGNTPLPVQAIDSRQAGSADVSDVRRLCVDPTMRQVVGRRASRREKRGASSSELGRFETEMLASRSPSVTPRRNDDDPGVLGEADGW